MNVRFFLFQSVLADAWPSLRLFIWEYKTSLLRWSRLLFFHFLNIVEFKITGNYIFFYSNFQNNPIVRQVDFEWVKNLNMWIGDDLIQLRNFLCWHYPIKKIFCVLWKRKDCVFTSLEDIKKILHKISIFTWSATQSSTSVKIYYHVGER